MNVEHDGVFTSFERMNKAQKRRDLWAKLRPVAYGATVIAATFLGAWIADVLIPRLAGL